MKYLIALILCLLMSINSYGSNLPNSPISKMNGLSRITLQPALTEKVDNNKLSAMLQANKIKYPFYSVGGDVFVDVLLKLRFDSDISRLYGFGCKLFTSVKNIAVVSIPAERLIEIASQSWVTEIEASKKNKLLLDSSRQEIHADLVHSGISLAQPYLGDVVIVGVFDTGIDFTHPDFSNDNGTRILYLWDMSDNTTGTHPEGFDWGTEYTKQDIDTKPSEVLERDGDEHSGHGTHVTGIAAGGGKFNSDMTGIAPNADIIFIKGLITPNDKGGFTDPYIISGCQYIFQKAEQLGKPAVINLSLGTPLGAHDGTDLLDEALSGLVGPGRIIVAAAGNEGDPPIHAGDIINSGEAVETLILPINICDIFDEYCGDIPNLYMTAADIWYSSGSVDTISIGAYQYSIQGLTFLGDISLPTGQSLDNKYFITGQDTIGLVSIDAQTINNPSNNDGNIFVKISNGADTNILLMNYIWSIRLKGKKDGKVDLWTGIPVPEEYNISGIKGKQMYGDNLMTVGSPANGKKIISVGSYITKNTWLDIDDIEESEGLNIGEISDFSSLGPTRDGRTAPIISAPGELIFAPLSGHLTQSIGYYRYYVLQGGKYQGMRGTSMATPHVVGVVALMLQAEPTLDFNDIVDIFKKTGREDDFTGTLPNEKFGYGKIDAFAALGGSTSIKDNNNHFKGIKIFPNPAHNRLMIDINFIKKQGIVEIYNSLGLKIERICRDIQSSSGSDIINIDVSNYPEGAYYIRYYAGTENYSTKFLVIH